MAMQSHLLGLHYTFVNRQSYGRIRMMNKARVRP